MRNILLLLNVFFVNCASYTKQTCSADQIFDGSTLSCLTCPSNMRPNPRQSYPTSCVCNQGYYPISASTCAALGVNKCPRNQFFNVLGPQGIYQTPISTNICTNCSPNAYVPPDSNGTTCTLCLRNMIYSLAQNSCICANTVNVTMFETSRGCFTSAELSQTSSISASGSKYYSSLKYLFPQCAYFNDLTSCSQLVNLCTYSMGYADASNEPQCKFFSIVSGKQSFYDLSGQKNVFYWSSGKFTKSQQIKIKLLMYLPSGNFYKQKDMKLPDILRCGMPSDNSIGIQLGNNIEVSCSFNFDYLVQKSQSKTYQSYFYEMFVQGQNNKYFPVSVYIGSSLVPSKRFFIEDAYTSTTFINVLNDFKFTLSLNSTGYLISPTLKVLYKKLSIQGNLISPSADKTQSLKYSIKFTYNLQTFWPAFIGIFIAINIIVLIQSIIRTYIGNLNRQSPLNFFYYFMSIWSLWVFYFLIAISGYWFLFCKTTQGVYIFIPDSTTDGFYVTFFVIAAIMGVFRLITVFVDKRYKLGYEIFLINWQKTDNSWRQIFIINSLAQFYTHRTISFFWMLFTLIFFLVGLNWQAHSAQVAHTNLTNIYYFNPLNRIFLYFLSSSCFLIIGISFKFLRRISVLKWPYPFEDFADYCNVTNISLFFMRKRSSQAYYMHSQITRHVQVSFSELNAVVRQIQNKGRGLTTEYNFNPGQSMFIIYTCRDLQQKFNNMLKRVQEDQSEHSILLNKRGSQKNSFNKNFNLRDKFVDIELKPYLDEAIKIQSRNSRTMIRRLFGIPEIDLRDQNLPRKKNTILRDEYLDIVSDVFPNGNQFQEIHTIIILFLMFVLITGNVCASALIAYFISQYVIDKWIGSSCRERLQKMTKVKEGFML